MALSPQRPAFPSGGALFSIAGFCYCLFAASAWGQSVLCLTSGCALFVKVLIFGFSPWEWGAAAFLLIFLLCLKRKVRAAFILAWLMLFLDCLFLLYMLFIAPCVSCLGAAVLMALNLCFLRRSSAALNGGKPHGASIALLAWGLLFFANSMAAVNELVPPWALVAGGDNSTRVFFSPSCPACRDTVAALAGKAEFYPVAKDPEDILRIAALQKFLDESIPFAEAFERSQKLTLTPPPMLQDIALHFRLIRNKAYLAKMNFTALPVILIQGAPWAQAKPPASGAATSRSGEAQGNEAVQARPPAGGFELPPELRDGSGAFPQCPQDSPEPCE